MTTNINVQGNENTQVNLLLGNSVQYGELLDLLKTQEKLFNLTPEDEQSERLEISGKINDLRDRIRQFKRDVLALAETFDKLEINTERLKRAKEFFDKGEFGEARAVLEIELEQMQGDQALLLQQKSRYETDVLPKLVNNAEEFLILALTIQTDYSHPNRFEDTCKHFRSSIDSDANKGNVFQFAHFLQEHRQFGETAQYYVKYLEFSLTESERATALNNLANLHSDENKYGEALAEYKEALEIRRRLVEANPGVYLPDVAMTLNNLAVLHQHENKYGEALGEYEEALEIHRRLAEANPDAYLPDVAMTLNNLANLHCAENKYDAALAEHEEALEIRRRLAEANPSAYLPAVADTLNNLANLHSDESKYGEALVEYEEALEIYRRLAEANPGAYLPDVAMTLNNLAILHKDENKYDEALGEYDEALEIYRQLVEANSDAYLPYVATTLNNLAVLHETENKYGEALKEYEEALEIYRRLAEASPGAYLPDVAMTLINLGIFYQVSAPERERSIGYSIEAAAILRPIVEKVPYTQKYLETAMAVLGKWELSEQEISQMVDEWTANNNLKK